MKQEKLDEALDQISEAHVAEAAKPQKAKSRIFVRYILPSAAVIALVIVLAFTAVSHPFVLMANAVSVADYPNYAWVYREGMRDTAASLGDFFAESIQTTLASAEAENKTYSPINLYMALCLMAEVTGRDEQILSVLHADSVEALREQANEIWNACYFDDGDQTLLANSLWLDDTVLYDQATMDTLAENYYTSVYQRDLSSGGTAKAIRAWLNQQTGNLLQADADKITLDPEVILALYSTVYFQAKWVDSVEFQSKNNTEAVFHAPSGDLTRTFMNKQKLQTNYYWAENFGAVSLGMKDGSSMWLVLPDEEKSLRDVLDSEAFRALIFGSETYENAKYMYVNLSLPKFDIHSGEDLKEDLQSLGITDVFQVSDETLYFTNVNQATRVAIDEKGVTAASYIELPGAGAAAPPEEVIDFVLDRPFLFVITNRYGLPLFAGVVNEP